MWFGLISLFPDSVQTLKMGITGRAIKENIASLHTFNPRNFTQNAHQTVDDKPYGGGPGMLMMPGPLKAAIQAAKNRAPQPVKVIYLSPQGKQFNQKAAAQFALEQTALIFVAGRYEGIDERVIEQEIDEEWSIGDYILTGGELAAFVMMDSIIRLLPHVVGDADSITEDSLTTGLLKYPQYTRPENFEGSLVPPVLLSGDHQSIREWRLTQSIEKTRQRRPDLLAQKTLSPEELAFLSKHKPEK